MEPTNQKHVVCTFDDGYVKYCVVMLTSLFDNNPSENFNIHIIAESLTQQSQELLRQTTAKYSQDITFHFVGKELIEALPMRTDGYITIATYFRCFIPIILPENIDRVLYIDCDLIVRDSLAPLFALDLEGLAMCAVEDCDSQLEGKLSRFGIPENYTYFNAGVLMINLDYWRKNDVINRLLTWISIPENSEKIALYDQDLMNAVLYDEVKLLPARWNMQDIMLRRKRHSRKENDEAIDREMPHTVIAHFTGPRKPWTEKGLNPFRKEFEHYLDKTPFKGERPKTRLAYQINKTLFYPIWDILHLRNGYRHFKPIRTPFK